MVIKPNDGAGSQDTFICRDASQRDDTLATFHQPARLESFVDGLAASVAFLCGPTGCFALPACSQRLRIDSRISYIGGALPLANAESGTTAWSALKFGPSTFGVFDAFADEAGRQAHLNGQIAAALMANAATLLSSPPNIEKVELLAAKLPA